MIEIFDRITEEALRHIMYCNFHFYLALLLNRWLFTMKSLITMFSWHSLRLFIITWCITSWLSCYEYIHITLSATVSVDYACEQSYIIITPPAGCHLHFALKEDLGTLYQCGKDYWKGSLRKRKWCNISRTPIKVHWSDEKLKKMSTTKLHIVATTGHGNNVAW